MNEKILPTRPAELYQLLIAFFSLLIIIVVAIVDVNSRITALETKQVENENFRTELREALDKIHDTQTKILIELQNKKNR